MTDQERKDLAEAYRTMMDLAAWKDFESRILNPIEANATKDEDAIPTMDLTMAIGRIGECRGKRWAIGSIKSSLNYILEGLK